MGTVRVDQLKPGDSTEFFEIIGEATDLPFAVAEEAVALEVRWAHNGKTGVRIWDDPSEEVELRERRAS